MKKILIVEDDEAIRTELIKQLRTERSMQSDEISDFAETHLQNT